MSHLCYKPRRISMHDIVQFRDDLNGLRHHGCFPSSSKLGSSWALPLRRRPSDRLQSRSAESATGVPDGSHTFDANMPGVALHVPALALYLNHVVRNAATRWHFHSTRRQFPVIPMLHSGRSFADGEQGHQEPCWETAWRVRPHCGDRNCVKSPGPAWEPAVPLPPPSSPVHSV